MLTAGGDDLLVASVTSITNEAKAANAELFAFTLDKSSGSFSPTTRYRDYAIGRSLIHWETQSITRAESATGLRYRNHEREGRGIQLFTRLRADDRSFWFLGPATYRDHVGEKPMAIRWELQLCDGPRTAPMAHLSALQPSSSSSSPP